MAMFSCRAAMDTYKYAMLPDVSANASDVPFFTFSPDIPRYFHSAFAPVR